MSGGSRRPCPDCGKALWVDSFLEGRYECHNDSCHGWGVYFDKGGVLVDAAPGTGDFAGLTCTWCQSSLSGGTGYLPYEDGSNSHAYIICPSCKQQNIQYGFGEND